MASPTLAACRARRHSRSGPPISKATPRLIRPAGEQTPAVARPIVSCRGHRPAPILGAAACVSGIRAGGASMGTGVGLRQVGYFDCAGGGQVVVVEGIAYIGHMRSPHGTSIVDVRDPKNCKRLATIGMPPGTHSHKVRVADGLMVVNHEINGADTNPVPPDFRGGIGIYDVANPASP